MTLDSRDEATSMELLLIGALIARPDVLAACSDLELDDFVTFDAQRCFEGVRELQEHGTPITVESLAQWCADRAALGADKNEPYVRSDVLAETLRDLERAMTSVSPAMTVERVRAEVATLKHLRSEREQDREIVEIASRDDRPDERLVPPNISLVSPPAPEKPRWHWARAAVPDIRAHATDPRAPITLGGEILVELEPGDIMTVVAASKRGKTSLALCALHEHARDRGPALGCSLELPARQLVAREIGARRDASWRDVLRGQISDADMYSAIPERLAVVDRDETEPLVAAGMAVAAMRVQYPNEPILVAVDYLQLLPADDQREIRARVDAAMKQLSRWARDHAVMVLALSQSSRASSRALQSGERTGADAMDAGAESASIERWSSAIITLGVQGEPDERGVAPVELSIAGQRMDRGDQVRAARYDGRTGLWTLVGEARPAAEARAEREASHHAAAVDRIALAVVGACSTATSPLSDRALAELVHGRAADRRSAVARLLADPDSGIVRCGRSSGGKTPKYPIWTRDRAVSSGISIHDADPERV